MKETGIIMSGNHPKLILDGIKPMTRRTQGLGKINQNPENFWLFDFIEKGAVAVFDQPSGDIVTVKCPYGQVGDRLWVRETFCLDGVGRPYYKATPPNEPPMRWRPSIHMPRWASRITLEITEVRVERLQEIDLIEIESEGVQPYFNELDQELDYLTPFKELWDSLNAKRGYGWNSNCWVWVLSFKVIS